MINAENIRDVEQRRLAWRCRRGMLELDIVLQKFVDQHFNQLTMSELQVFDEMLGLPDNEFWNMLQTKDLHLKSKAQQTIIKRLHNLQAQ